MGYDAYNLRIPITVSRHNSEQDREDDAAAADLREDIEELIASNPRYARVASLGVEGGI